MCLVGNTNASPAWLQKAFVEARWKMGMAGGGGGQCDVRRMSGSREEQMQRVVHF